MMTDNKPSKELVTLKEFFEMRLQQFGEKIDNLTDLVKELSANSVHRSQFDILRGEVNSLRAILTNEETGIQDRLRKVEGNLRLALRVLSAISGIILAVITALLIGWLSNRLGL